MPRVSVHMPVYNAMPYLAEAVESILAQTYGKILSSSSSTTVRRTARVSSSPPMPPATSASG
jgi:cellulose synthase/poly-beta-1,6-N-acetylglucosamine synthase-like glycosyltransferase